VRVAEKQIGAHAAHLFEREEAQFVQPVVDQGLPLGLRGENGWGPETHLLAVSGGSHAGSVAGIVHFERLARGHSVHLVPLEPIAATSRARFAIAPPWRKHAWFDPETGGTD